MSRESKRRAKAQRREARKRAEKTRRQLADHCAQWMYDAEDAWVANDFARARQCFQRILHVRPTHQAANERMAELFFIDGLQADGLRTSIVWSSRRSFQSSIFARPAPV